MITIYDRIHNQKIQLNNMVVIHERMVSWGESQEKISRVEAEIKRFQDNIETLRREMWQNRSAQC